MYPQLTAIDRCIGVLDGALRTLSNSGAGTGRRSPDAGLDRPALSAAESRLAAGLMRVNHSGEVCAQALYQGQALTARNSDLKASLERAAEEENDHLHWCGRRVAELGSHTSLLNPLWYAGSLALGAAAGALGDRWNLGFLGETERQVTAHLESHLARLPAADRASRAILEQMREDEQRHATQAMQSGGAELPAPVKHLMRLSSKLMTRTAFWF
jgi:ubiquinone biosynthesis monooxygenase Coq7